MNASILLAFTICPPPQLTADPNSGTVEPPMLSASLYTPRAFQNLGRGIF
ncbi:MAG: hypothetical protein AB7N65_04495 [Vicinamibacterales bacterium]